MTVVQVCWRCRCGHGAKFWVSRSRETICPFQSPFAAVREHGAVLRRRQSCLLASTGTGVSVPLRRDVQESFLASVSEANTHTALSGVEFVGCLLPLTDSLVGEVH